MKDVINAGIASVRSGRQIRSDGFVKRLFGCVTGVGFCMTAMFTVPQARAFAERAPSNYAVVQQQDSFLELLQIIDPNADAVLFASNMRRASDKLMHLLEGMDRDQMLIGSRPIDQLLSALDIPTQVAEHRGSAMLLYLPERGSLRDTSDMTGLFNTALFLVPVRNAGAFLDANFERQPDGALLHGSGRTMHSRTIGQHVLLGFERDRVAQYQPAGVARSWLVALGDEGLERLRAGEIMFVGNDAALHASSAVLNTWLPGFAALTDRVMQTFERQAWTDTGMFSLSLDFDPLALIVRELVTVDSSHVQMHASAPQQSQGLMRHLPNRPYALVTGWDLRHPSMRSMLDLMLQAAGEFSLPPWFELVDRMEMGVYLGPDGETLPLANGMLHNSSVVLHTTQPTVLRIRMRDWLNAQPNVELSWQTQQTLADGAVGDVVHARFTTPADQPMLGVASAMMLGPNGWRGHVLERDTAVVVLFNRRGDLRDALAQVRHQQSASMQADPILQTMYMWFPEHASAAILLPIGVNLAILRDVIEQFPLLNAQLPDALPQIPVRLPPIGIAFDVVDAVRGPADQTIDIVGSTTVIPAQLLTIGLDELLRSMAAGRQPIPGNDAADDDG